MINKIPATRSGRADFFMENGLSVYETLESFED